MGEAVEKKSWMSLSLQSQVAGAISCGQLPLVPGSLDQVVEYRKVWYTTEQLITGKLGNHRLMGLSCSGVCVLCSAHTIAYTKYSGFRHDSP